MNKRTKTGQKKHD